MTRNQLPEPTDNRWHKSAGILTQPISLTHGGENPFEGYHKGRSPQVGFEINRGLPDSGDRVLHLSFELSVNLVFAPVLVFKILFPLKGRHAYSAAIT